MRFKKHTKINNNRGANVNIWIARRYGFELRRTPTVSPALILNFAEHYTTLFVEKKSCLRGNKGGIVDSERLIFYAGGDGIDKKHKKWERDAGIALEIYVGEFEISGLDRYLRATGLDVRQLHHLNGKIGSRLFR